MSALEHPARTAELFLRALYGEDAPGFVPIWELPGRTTAWFPAGALGDAARAAAALAGEHNVYFGVGLQAEDRGAGERGRADTVVAIPGLWADLDVQGPAHKAGNLPPSIDAVRGFLAELPLRPTAVIHSGHGVQAWWVFRELWVFGSAEERRMAAELALGWQAFVQGAARARGWHVDSTADLARVLRLPGTMNRKLEPVPVRLLETGGPRYNPGDFDGFVVQREDSARASVPGAGLPDDTGAMLAFLSADCPHDDWVRIGMALHHADPVAGLGAWDDWSRSAPGRYAGETEMARRWASFKAVRPSVVTIGTLRRMAVERGYVPYRNGAATATDADDGEPAGEPGKRDLTQDGLALDIGDAWWDARYVASWSRWMLYRDGTWKHDDKLEHMTRVRGFLRAKADALPAEFEGAKKALRNATTVAAVAGLVRSNRAQAATVGQWDADPWMLATPAGTVDLRTGILRAAEPGDYLTKTTAVAPAEGDGAPLWRAFLRRITAGDGTLEGYLQRFAGYALTGSVQEHVFAFGYGTGANGKSVFLGALHGILGDYACTVPTEVLMVSQQDRHPTELARLRGVRLAVVSETEQGKRWAEAKIKALTGGDPIAARYMREDFFEFLPQFKLFVVGNHRPALRGVDEAMRRRLHCVPFTVTIPPGERDPGLGAKLRREWPAILSWALEGCRAWASGGLRPPDSVRLATEQYLEAEDAFALWVEACARPDRAAWEANGTLFASWKAWAEEAGEYPGTQKGFSQTMLDRGYEPFRNNNIRGSLGLRIMPRTGGPWTPGDQA